MPGEASGFIDPKLISHGVQPGAAESQRWGFIIEQPPGQGDGPLNQSAGYISCPEDSKGKLLNRMNSDCVDTVPGKLF